MPATFPRALAALPLTLFALAACERPPVEHVGATHLMNAEKGGSTTKNSKAKEGHGGKEKGEEKREGAHEQAHAPAHDAPHWAYAGKHEGPERWGELKPEFAACKTGESQTPIDLPASAPAGDKAAPLELHYGEVPLRVLNNGHTLQVESSGEQYFVSGGKRYDLVQFHFHSPSEHTVAGKSFDAELHFVHKDQDGKLAVLGVFLQKGPKANPLLAPIWEHMPMREAPAESVEGASVDVGAFLPKKPAYYSYSGSLTTPPCSEGVSWFVLAPPADISGDQVRQLQVATKGPSNRPVQELHGRRVSLFKP
jgi:carbonic anhydrase